MECIVLAGGFGTRLQSVVPDLPKPMAPVAGRPFLELLLGSLERRGIRRVVLSLGYRAEAITSHFGPRFGGLELVFEIEEQPLGTGGAIRRCLQRCQGEVAFALNGDTYLDLDFAAVHRQWQQHGRPVLVGLRIDDASRYGRLRTEGLRLLGFEEKGLPGPGLINSGHYLLPVGLFDSFDQKDPFSWETDVMQPHVQRLGFEVFETDASFIDIGVPDDYARAQTMLAHLVRDI